MQSAYTCMYVSKHSIIVRFKTMFAGLDFIRKKSKARELSGNPSRSRKMKI